MNDFTKEELQDIEEGISAVRNSSTISSMNYGELHEKIQSMIDNYCEHDAAFEYRLNTPVEELFDGNQRKVSLCKKCDKYFL